MLAIGVALHYDLYLEAIYYRRPLVMCRCEIFKTDIWPKGFQVIGFDSYVDHGTVQRARDVLVNPAEIEAMVEHNYALSRKFYSYSALRKRLKVLTDQCQEQGV